MSTKDEARKLAVEKRQHDEHLQDTMLNRFEEELEHSTTEAIDEEARKLVVENRLHEEHLQDTMLSRSEEKLSQEN